MNDCYLRMPWKIAALLTCILLSHASPTFGEDFTSTVIRVADGDTLDVFHNRKAKRIRLNGIDCPEKSQAFGSKAKQATSDLAFGKQVTIVARGLDKYRRIIGDVILPDGKNLNQELVRTGMCWWYRKYAQKNTILESLEADAREGKRGLWVDSAPVPPWEWRRERD